jgi:hypothetical protein
MHQWEILGVLYGKLTMVTVGATEDVLRVADLTLRHEQAELIRLADTVAVLRQAGAGAEVARAFREWRLISAASKLRFWFAP